MPHDPIEMSAVLCPNVITLSMTPCISEPAEIRLSLPQPKNTPSLILVRSIFHVDAVQLKLERKNRIIGCNRTTDGSW
jgi:hypothetical protein